MGLKQLYDTTVCQYVLMSKVCGIVIACVKSCQLSVVSCHNSYPFVHFSLFIIATATCYMLQREQVCQRIRGRSFAACACACADAGDGGDSGGGSGGAGRSGAGSVVSRGGDGSVAA